MVISPAVFAPLSPGCQPPNTAGGKAWEGVWAWVYARVSGGHKPPGKQASLARCHLSLDFAAPLKDGALSMGSSQDNNYLLDVMTDISLPQRWYSANYCLFDLLCLLALPNSHVDSTECR